MINQTTMWSFNKLRRSGELPRREQQVLSAISELRVATDREIATHTGLEINQVTGRRNSLANKKKIEVAYIDKSFTGRSVNYWKVTE